MATGKPTFYWDAAPIIAWITDELRTDASEMDGLADVADMVDNGKATIITSVLWRVEVLQIELTPKQKKKLYEIFDCRVIEEVGIDSRIMDLAGEIRAFHRKETDKSKLKNVRTPDAIHLASAIHYEVDEFHTFDGKTPSGNPKGLFLLDGNVAGRRLKICAPQATQLRLKIDIAKPDTHEDDIY